MITMRKLLYLKLRGIELKNRIHDTFDKANNASIELEVGKEATLKTTSTYNNSQFSINSNKVPLHKGSQMSLIGKLSNYSSFVF